MNTFHAPATAVLQRPGHLAGVLWPCAYAGIALLVLGLAWLPIEWTVHRFLYEDFFYYLTIARYVLDEGVVSFDGSAPTNGFHPLWMIVSIGCQALGGNALGPHLALTAAALLHLGQVAFVYRICRRALPAGASHFAAILFGVNYRVIACNLCGLETPLVGLAVLVLLDRWLTETGPMTPRRAAIWGGLLGVSVWCRADLLLLLGLTVAAIAVLPRFGTTAGRRLRAAALTAGVALLVLLPWLTWSYAQSGTLLPNSKRALEIWAVAHFDFGQSLSSNLSLLEQKAFGAAWWLSDTANWLGLLPVVLPEQRKLGGGLIAATVGLVWLGLVLPKRRADSRLWLGPWLYALLHLAYYCLFSTARVRYLIPFCLIAYLCCASLLGRQLLRHRLDPRALVLAALLVFNVAMSSVAAFRQHQGSTRTHVHHLALLQMARWIDANTHPDAKLGSWNSGIMGYYSGRQVTNLDGVVNDEVLVPLERRELAAYIASRDIEYLVDAGGEIEKFMDGYSGDRRWSERFPTVHEIRPVVARRAETDQRLAP